jgi:HEAT repeat protein
MESAFDTSTVVPNAGSCLPSVEGGHSATIRRMVEAAEPFRPHASDKELVEEFANGKNRPAAFIALCARGLQVLPAVRDGLNHSNWHIRSWSAALADNFADAETLHALVPLLRDPKAAVRVWAVHSLSCESCKSGPNPIDAIPLLLERIESDDSIRVRRQALAMLAHHRSPDKRVLPVFKRVLAEESDRKLRLHAEHGLQRYAAAGIRE